MRLLGKSITQLLDLLNKKEISQEELYSYFIGRVKKYDPQLNSYLTLIEKPKQAKKGILYGLPIAFKDNFCTKGIKTTASSKVLENFNPPYSATVVERLENAGVVILGKTNMDAWAHGSSTETSDFGPTKNPWDLTRAPGGSSGGSTAAMAAYLTPAAIGSETAGSIRQPAAWCGVVGLKPTYGRVSRYGVIAMGSSLDCPGPITSTVEDAALLLQVIAGKDQFDATTTSNEVQDYVKLLKKPRKMTIGIADDYFESVEDEVKIKALEAIEALNKLGHKIKKVQLISPKYAISVYTIIQRSEVSSNLARYDGIRFGNTRESFGQEAKRRIMLGTYTLSHGYYDAFYKKAQQIRTLIIEDYKRAFKDVDVIISPTTPTTALKLGEFEKYPFFGEVMDMLNEPAAIAGLPAINFPVGLDKNTLPVGLQIMGNYFKEDDILNLAGQFEKETGFFDTTQQILEKYPD